MNFDPTILNSNLLVLYCFLLLFFFETAKLACAFPNTKRKIPPHPKNVETVLVSVSFQRFFESGSKALATRLCIHVTDNSVTLLQCCARGGDQ